MVYLKSCHYFWASNCQSDLLLVTLLLLTVCGQISLKFRSRVQRLSSLRALKEKVIPEDAVGNRDVASWPHTRDTDTFYVGMQALSAAMEHMHKYQQ
jgi:hypothetical protein